MKQTYFDTLAAGLDAVQRHLDDNRATEAEKSFRDAYFSGGVAYGEVKQTLHPLATFRGKSCMTTRKDGSIRSRKALVINIYRLESGRYEFNVYIA